MPKMPTQPPKNPAQMLEAFVKEHNLVLNPILVDVNSAGPGKFLLEVKIGVDFKSPSK